MITKWILARTAIPVLQRGLDAAALRQRVTAENLANVSTPNYQRKVVVFESELARALDRQGVQGARTHPDHLPIGRQKAEEIAPRVETSSEPTNGTGVNNVDVDREMSTLAKNQIYYAYAARLVAKSFAAIRESIRGRTG